MSMTDVRAYHLPYCLEQVSNGKWVILNRRYKPLGMTKSTHIDYEPWAVKLKGLTASVATKISWNNEPAREKIWLYNDGCVPTDSEANMEAYLSRLAVLAKLQVTPDR